VTDGRAFTLEEAGAAEPVLKAAWDRSVVGRLTARLVERVGMVLRPLAGRPPVRALFAAWDESWVGALARGLWHGQGPALVGLVVLVGLDAWAFNLAARPLARWAALAVTALPVAAGGPAGLYVTLATIPFVPDAVALALTGLLVAATLARRLDAAGWRPARLAPRPGWPVTLLGLLLVVATVTSVSPAGSFRYLGVWAVAIGLYWVAAGTATADGADGDADRHRGEKVLARAALALGLSAALGGLHGLYQFAAHTAPVKRAWIDPLAFPSTGTRVFSFWGNPNVFALHLVLTAPLLAVSLWTAKGRAARLGAALGVVAAGSAAVLTLSRAGWAGLAVAALVISLSLDRRILLAAAAAAALALVVSPGLVLARVVTVFHFSDPTAVHRIRVWESAWRMARDYWYSGLGLSWRAFAAVYPQYAIQGRVAFHAHNHYLETLLELGVLGFAALHAVLLRPLAWLARLGGHARRTVAGYVLTGCGAAIAGALAFGIGEPIFYLPRPILLAWAVLGLATAARREGGPGHA